MANLKEEIKWEAGIYQLETSDPVVGGPDGIDNRQAKQLANRTAYLKKQIETNASSVNTQIAQKLDTSVYNRDKNTFVTQNEIKNKLDRTEKAADSSKLDGHGAKHFATDSAVVHKEGEETINGKKTFGNIVVSDIQMTSGSWRKIRFINDKNEEVFVENAPSAHSYIMQMVQRDVSASANLAQLFFPKKSGTLAIDAETVHKTGDETISGNKVFEDILTIGDKDWVGVKIRNKNKEALTLDIRPAESDSFGTISFNGDGGTKNIFLPKKTGTVVLSSDFAGSVQQNGYTKLPGGLIIQWGLTPNLNDKVSNGFEGHEISFNLSFPNACFVVLATPQGGYTQGGNLSDYTKVVSNSKFKIIPDNTDSSFNYKHFWFAIGC